MSEARFTPGPWEVDQRAKCRVFKSGEPNRGICSAGGYFTNQHDFTDENEANARLIAAAPSLLAACEDFVRNCPACHGAGSLPDATTADGLSPAGLCVWCKKHRAAIALATPTAQAEGGTG